GYGFTSPPGRRVSSRSAWPWPTTRSAQVRLSRPHATAVGANAPGTKRLYELTLGAYNRHSSRRQSSWPARKLLNAGSSAAKRLDPSSFASERWMWHELPSRSLYLAMKLIETPSCEAISF